MENVLSDGNNNKNQKRIFITIYIYTL